MTIAEPKDFLRGLFDTAVAAADPMLCVPAALPARPKGRVIVVGAGKASARMAEAVEFTWGPCEGLIITRDGYARTCEGIRIVEASHPVPDARGLQATAEMLKLVSGLDEDTFVLALISGGGSALLVQPRAGLTLQDKQAVNAALLASGAPIDQMNVVRKHLSLVKGGGLARAIAPARLLSLIISDVAGDDPAFIASGPTVADETTAADALAIIDRWHVAVPDAVRTTLMTAQAPGERGSLAHVENRVIAAPSQSIAAAQAAAEAAGCTVEVLGDAIEGEARDVAVAQAALVPAARARAAKLGRPVVLLSGGECTVTRRGSGSGGPNAEFVLSLLLALGDAPGVYAIACDTDGVDGAADIAGAVIGPDTLSAAQAAGLQPAELLDANDSHTFFGRLGAQVVTGPTLTNVNDFRAILVMPQ